MLRLLSILLFFLISPLSFAEDSNWYFSGTTSPTYLNPEAACISKNVTSKKYTHWEYTFPPSTLEVTCYGETYDINGNVNGTNVLMGSLQRSGDCPIGTNFDEVTGSCTQPLECIDRRGEPLGYFSGSSLASMCVNGCTAKAYGGAIGIELGDGSSSWGANYRYTGGECDEGSGEEKAPSPCPDDWTKDGQDVCRPDPGATAKEGETTCDVTTSGDCLTYDPGVSINPVPTGTEGLEGEGTEGQETGAGGVVVGGGSGSLSSGSIDANGDGLTGCDPNDPNCMEINSGSVTGGLVCDVPPVCDGDEVMCAILMQEFLQRCPSEQFEKPQLGSTDQKLADIQAEFDTAWQDVKTDVESYFSATLPSGGSIPTRITTIFGVNIDFSLSRFLPQLSIIANLIVAAAWIIAAGIVLTRRG